MSLSEEEERLVDLFLCGKVPEFNHAKHVMVARILARVPFGRELMHLGIQVTATRAGVPQKYSREITDAEWAKLVGPATRSVRADS